MEPSRVKMQRRPDFQGMDVSLSQYLSEDEAKTVISSINQFCEQVLRYCCPF